MFAAAVISENAFDHCRYSTFSSCPFFCGVFNTFLKKYPAKNKTYAHAITNVISASVVIVFFLVLQYADCF